MITDFEASSHKKCWIDEAEARKVEQAAAIQEDEQWCDSVERRQLLKAYFLAYIREVCQLLSLPHSVFTTAALFLAHLYCKHSMVDADPRVFAPTALFAAAKCEEHAIGVKTLVATLSSKSLTHKYHEFPFSSREVMDAEYRLVRALPTLATHHPHPFLERLLLRCRTPALQTAAWSMCNDLYLTDVILFNTPQQLALSSLYMAAASFKPNIQREAIAVLGGSLSPKVAEIVKEVMTGLSPLMRRNVMSSGQTLLKRLLQHWRRILPDKDIPLSSTSSLPLAPPE